MRASFFGDTGTAGTGETGAPRFTLPSVEIRPGTPEGERRPLLGRATPCCSRTLKRKLAITGAILGGAGFVLLIVHFMNPDLF